MGGLASPAPRPGGRAASLESSERRLGPLLDRVPITRVYDATALDYLGFPVWAAVTPLAADLTVHSGKGATAAAARVGAVMEAVERVCAERVDPDRITRASYRSLGPALAADPDSFDLPFETGYARDRELSWVQAHDLPSGGPVCVALDLVVSPAGEGVCVGPETNGLAAGNTLQEAIIHGLYELIERDSAAVCDFVSRYADDPPPRRRLDPESLPAAAAASMDALTAAGVSVELEELTGELGVPAFRATVVDRGFPGHEGRPARFEGLGCHLDATIALETAVAEAAQSHTAVLLGARDAFEGGPGHAQPGPEGVVRRLLAREQRTPFRGGEGPPDLEAQLDDLLERLAAAGLHRCLAVELTRPDLGVPVARLLVPGLAAPYGESTRRPPERLLARLR